MFGIWVEWELGQEDLIFRTREDAINWLNSGVLEGTEYTTADEIIADGLADIKTLEIWEAE